MTEFIPPGMLRRYKRKVRRNAYGNLVGYVGSNRSAEINGCGIDPYTQAEEKAAAAWLAGRIDWRNAAWE